MRNMKRTIFKNIESEILAVLDKAQSEVLAMLAWFTSEPLTNVLIKLVKRGIEVKIILSNNEWNLLNKSNLDKLISSGGQIHSYGSQNPLDGNFLHRKMCIVDRKIVMNGAFNWTKNASRNKEDYSFNDDKTDADNCLNEFTELWKNSEIINWNKIESSATKTINELEILEKDGISPDELITEVLKTKTNDVQVATIIKENEAIDSGANIVKYEDKVLRTFNLHTSDDEFDYVYENDLDVWGIEYGGKGFQIISNKMMETSWHWYKLKFKIDNMIINVAVRGRDFIEVLKTNKDYFLYWSKFKKIPLSMVNDRFCGIKLFGPLRLKVIDSRMDYPMKQYCNYKLVTEINHIVCIKISRFTNSDLMKFQISENDEYIK